MSNLKTRDRILEAALACPGGFTMAKVAEKSGLSRQAVYLHFRDRGQLIAALAAQTAPPDPAGIYTSSSARTALAELISQALVIHPRLAAITQASGQRQAAEGWTEICRAVTQRFRDESALAPQLSVETAAELLAALTGPALYEELVIGRRWPPDRYRSHIAFLAASALTK